MNNPRSILGHSFGTVLRGMLPSDCFPAPAAGYRHYGTGAYTPDGYGDYWSSSPALSGDHGAGYLAFNSGNVKPLNSNQRACGFAVRCVQASAGCFHYGAEPRTNSFRRKACPGLQAKRNPRNLIFDSRFFFFDS